MSDLVKRLRGRSLNVVSPFDMLRQFPRLPLEQSEVLALLALADEAATALQSFEEENGRLRARMENLIIELAIARARLNALAPQTSGGE